MTQIFKRTRRRESPTRRKEEILNAAIELASKIGYLNLTRDGVAEAANTSSGLVTCYFTNMEQLKKAVMDAAIKREILPIIAQGLSLGDEQTFNISSELKQKVLAFLTN